MSLHCILRIKTAPILTFSPLCALHPSRTIPLADVVDSFDVFHTGQGAQGIMGRPSKQQLDTVFGSHTDTDVVLQILEKGQLQASGEFFPPESSGTANACQCVGGASELPRRSSLGGFEI